MGLSANITELHGCPDSGSDLADVHAESPALQHSTLMLVGCELFALELLRRGLIRESAELRALLKTAMRDKPVRL